VSCDGRDRHAFGPYCESDFARQLERELAAALERVRELQSTLALNVTTAMQLDAPESRQSAALRHQDKLTL